MKYPQKTTQPENPFAAFIPNQTFAYIPYFELECGEILYNVPVAYSTRGTLSPQGDNAMVICHALSGSSDVADWWGPLLGGSGKAFDITRFFVVCMNSLGSPYGTASPVTARDGDSANEHYGPEFPLTTIRDDVRLCKALLDDLGVKQIAAVIGGSMGGMLVLEFAYFGTDYVRCIVPIATSARHSAWCISWGEAQRQSIYSDPKYEDGYYPDEDPPTAGLGAARMSALLTYRSRDSFESRFGRNVPNPSRRQNINRLPTNPSSNQHFNTHNEGHRRVGLPRLPTTHAGSPIGSRPSTPLTGKDGISGAAASSALSTASPAYPAHLLPPPEPSMEDEHMITDPQFHGATPLPAISPPVTSDSTSTTTPATLTSNPTVTTSSSIASPTKPRPTTYFSAQSYLRYQGEKFIKRFDANCYIALTRKLDTHDVSLHYAHPDPSDAPLSATETLRLALSLIKQPTLVLGIESDGLFTFAEQQEIAAGIPNARLERIESSEGHDAFLLQFEQVNRYVLEFLREVLPDLYERAVVEESKRGSENGGDVEGEQGFGKVVKNSVFGEAEVEDITAW